MFNDKTLELVLWVPKWYTCHCPNQR